MAPVNAALRREEIRITRFTIVATSIFKENRVEPGYLFSLSTRD